jgi:hypothetical protein
MVVAVSHLMMGSLSSGDQENALCWQKLHIYNPATGETNTGMVVDKCMGCVSLRYILRKMKNVANEFIARKPRYRSLARTIRYPWKSWKWPLSRRTMVLGISAFRKKLSIGKYLDIAPFSCSEHMHASVKSWKNHRVTLPGCTGRLSQLALRRLKVVDQL